MKRDYSYYIAPAWSFRPVSPEYACKTPERHASISPIHRHNDSLYDKYIILRTFKILESRNKRWEVWFVGRLTVVMPPFRLRGHGPGSQPPVERGK